MKTINLRITGFLCLLALSAHARPAPIFTLARPTVEVHDFAEITLRQPAFKTGNPFTDLTLTGVFVGAEKDTVQVQGFCDAPDGSLFRLRFMPRKPGTYRFLVTGEFSGRAAVLCLARCRFLPNSEPEPIGATISGDGAVLQNRGPSLEWNRRNGFRAHGLLLPKD